METNETNAQSDRTNNGNEKEMGLPNQNVHNNQNLQLSKEALADVFNKMASKLEKGKLAQWKDLQTIESELAKVKTKGEFEAFRRTRTT